MILGDVPITTLDQLLAQYDVLLLDAYGVFMDSSGALPGSSEVLQRIEDSGRRQLVLTNDASRLPETTAARFGRMGLQVAEERIVTSGGLLPAYFRDHGLVGTRCAVLGPRDSEVYVERAGGELVPPGTDADVLVVGDEEGYPMLETLDAVVSMLLRKVDTGESIELLVPNPDLLYPKGGNEFGITSGAVAHLLQGVLDSRYPDRDDLRFVSLGKPHAPIYDEARRRAGSGRMVMIGDQLRTDILGAVRAGIDSVVVGTGLTPWDEDHPVGEAIPTYRMRSLAD